MSNPQRAGVPGFGQRLLNRIESAGNTLPDPSTLFLAGAVAVMLVAQIASSSG